MTGKRGIGTTLEHSPRSLARISRAASHAQSERLAFGLALEAPAVLRIDPALRPLVPRFLRLIDGYVDFLRSILSESSTDSFRDTVSDLRTLAEMFETGPVVDLCRRLDQAARTGREGDAHRCVEQLAGLMQRAIVLYD